jgi:hypothetical protein
MAAGALGRFVSRLIALPVTFVTDYHRALNETVALATGFRPPNAVDSLAPGNPMLTVMDRRPSAPYHSIIGDRGRRDTPNSSDGVVPYESSHLEGAQSECIVPVKHTAFDQPATIAEVDRILRADARGTP